MFQESLILAGMFSLDRYAKTAIPNITPELFSKPHYRELYRLVVSYYTKYSALPTTSAIAVELESTPMPEGLFNDAVDFLEGMSTQQPINEDWLCERAEKWAQERSIYNAMQTAIEIIDGNHKKYDKGAIPQLIADAFGVTFNKSVGIDYFSTFEEQWEYYQSPDNKIPFSVDVLNRVTKGGAKRKSLNIVMAGINVGKTTWLINMAESYLDQGLNVIYFSLEVDGHTIRERSDVSFMGENFDKVRSLEKHAYMNRGAKLRGKFKGEYVIYDMPASSVHTGHIRHVLNELKMKRGITFDVILVDYITLLNSSCLPPSSKADTNGYYTNVAEELRSLAKEMDAICWTAAQFNRSGQSADDPTMGDTGLSIGIQATSDFTLALAQPDELAKNMQVLCKVLKNRYGNKQSFGKFIMGLDNDLQKFYDVDEEHQKSYMDEADLNDFQQAKKPTTAEQLMKPTEKPNNDVKLPNRPTNQSVEDIFTTLATHSDKEKEKTVADWNF
ncbi:gp41 DNA primase-helicase subunit [Delftia phage PhiW-14]|uniref:Gp41 DNA primase-helicase subunit n=1 Tax=Delftia phage PhiW-14 TaxID=665032 RepID=C9DGK7_BPW14|nr:gp41 DNA primase-helicase subunit [Delftia phage PhiW-14]ACV50258.1 gp41 DNA primase-helicase subunit [Delftia phage PhiW-14]